MAACFGRTGKRLSLDLCVPPSVLARRGGISFGSGSVFPQNKPRMGRRGAISFEKEDINAIYVRQLGDVQLKAQENTLDQYILNNLSPAERKVLQGLASSSYKTRCGSKFSTVSGMRRRRRCSVKPSTDGQCLIDDYYRSSTKCLLSKTSAWAFDVFSLDQLSNGRPLFCMVIKLFQEHNLIEDFNLDIVKLMKFASMVEQGYHQNPYHNAIHAADVTQAMHCYIMQEKIARHMSPLETMTALVSAITHDLDHPGVNQAFLIATSNHLASLYKNTSVLENHHWRTAVGMIHESGVFDHLPIADQEKMIEQMKSLILATDMTRQQEFYTRLTAHVVNDDLDMAKDADRHFILQIALKCADISNPCRSWSTCKNWSKRVCDEFFQQGDYERKLSLPITNFCDRFKFKVSDIQTGFIDYVVQPLFKEFEKFLPCEMLDSQLENLRNNRSIWHSLSQDEVICSRPQSLDVDINSNFETKDCNDSISSSTADSGTESDGISSPMTSESSGNHSDLDELPSDIGDIHSDIVSVAERMEWCPDSSSRRRMSLPLSNQTSLVKDPFGRRESFPSVHDNRRTCLPHTNLYQAISFDRLVEKLTNIERGLDDFHRKEKFHSVNLDNLLSETRLSTLSPSLETSKITNYLVSHQLIH